MEDSLTGIVRFLQQYAPQELARLGARHPESAARLRAAGQVLGDGDEEFESDAALTMLSAVADQSTVVSASITERLSSARRLEVMGSMLSLFSSGGVVGATLGLDSIVMAAMLGTIGFLANAVPLVVNWLRGSPTGASVSQGLIKLRQCAWEAHALRASLSRTQKWKEDTEGTVRQVNELGHRAYSVLTELGYDTELRPI